MTTLDPAPFGKPTLLLESNLLSDTNDTPTLIPSGLLDTASVFSGSGDDGGREDAFSVQSPPCAARLDVAGFTGDDEPSEFVSNGLLDGPTQMRSMVNIL